MRHVLTLGGLGGALLLTAACGGRAETYTLYRDSSAGKDLRIHFATFDASESDPTFNMENCTMAAELLNANIANLNGGAHPVRFWCEKGGYKS